MKIKNYLVIVFFLLAPVTITHADDGCNYESLQGKEFTFREKSALLHRFGYQDWIKEPSSIGKHLDYESYVGKNGKLQESQVEVNRYSSFYIAILETCEKVYTRGGTESWPRSVADVDGSGDIYYKDTLRQVEALVGTKIWLNMSSVAKVQGLLTDDPKVTYTLAHLDPLEVTGFSAKPIDHGFSSGRPFYLIVKKLNGDRGYLAFDDRHYDRTFFNEDPIDPTWDKTVVEIVKKRWLKAGMSVQQVLLAWGKPESINKTVGSYGVQEQWVYGHGKYVYIENNKLTSFQFSQ